MTAHVVCTGCADTFKLATFDGSGWRAATRDLQRFLEAHSPCREKCGDRPPFTLRYDAE
jgi:hypothetical protein